MENKQYSTLKQRLEDVFAIQVYPWKSMTQAVRNQEGEVESLEIADKELVSKAIVGQVKQQYLHQGYKFDKETSNGILWFHKEKELLAANISSSDSRILISILKF